jgi:hypothetical protein
MKLSQAFANCGLDEIKALLDGGTLVIYSVARPTSPDKPIERSGALATFAFASPAFGDDAPSDAPGTVEARFVGNPINASGVGTPGFARAYKADGSTPVADFSAGPGDAEIKLSEVSTTANYPVALTRFRLQLPAE